MRGSCTREARRVDRARRVGAGPVPPPVTRPVLDPHRSRPLQGLPGPLRWDLGLPRAVQGGWVYYPGIPTRPTPLVPYPPCTPVLLAPHYRAMPHREQSYLGHRRRT